jgi:P-type Ca2+ transporter type 2C
MQDPPRDPKEAILRSGDLKKVTLEGAVISASALAAYVYGRARYGPSPQAGTMAFTTLVTAQLLHALSCRSNDPVLFARKRLQPNPYLRSALIGSFAVQLLALFVPGLRRLSGIADLSPAEYLLTAGLGGLPLLINEALKTTSAVETQAQVRREL